MNKLRIGINKKGIFSKVQNKIFFVIMTFLSPSIFMVGLLFLIAFFNTNIEMIVKKRLLPVLNEQ